MTDRYVLVFNATQTPYPIFDQYLTNMFWPQTIFENSTICQPSGLVPINTNKIWNISESNLSIEIIPFTNCQGIPIIITSVSSSNLYSSAFSINSNRIIIDFSYMINSSFRRLDSLNNLTECKKLQSY